MDIDEMKPPVLGSGWVLLGQMVVLAGCSCLPRRTLERQDEESFLSGNPGGGKEVRSYTGGTLGVGVPACPWELEFRN